MSTFATVVIIVSVIAIALSLTSYFRVKNVIGQLGKQDQAWFERAEERPLDELEVEDTRDRPLPRRPPRGRPRHPTQTR